MNKRVFSLFVTVLGLMLVIAACGGQTTEAPVVVTDAPVVATEAPVALSGDPLRGGLLYDKWWVVIGADKPTDDQPLWKTQTTNTRSGDATWRCKECHGYDYKGIEGAYGSGSHKTGFVGVMGFAGKDANDILAILKGSTSADHDFSTVMDEQALVDLALFISQEVMDYSQIVGPDNGSLSKDLATGETLFRDTCTECHGPEGLAINFAANVASPEYLGGLAAGDPWEFLHKIRFGQPGTEMGSALDAGWTLDEQAAVLAFAQTLTNESHVAQGGLLYDKWWKAIGAEAPTADQPLWKTQTTNTRTGDVTWRCKECHGYDYRGVEGAYGSGSHLTGFKGVFGSSGMSAEELTGWLNGTANPDHDFSAYLEEAQINMLVAFIQEGLTDTSAYINADKTVNGDAAIGQPLYKGCVLCHGEDGKAINFGDAAEPEYVGTVATDNPWEFWHKASFGQPGTKMPIGLNLGWSLQDIADLLAYAQTLPIK